MAAPASKLPRLSPSRINTFIKCPMQYRFQYVDAVPSLPSEAMVRGSFVHRVLELLLTRPSQHRTTEAAREDFNNAQNEFIARDDFRLLGLDDAGTELFWESSRECVRAYYRIERPSDANIVELEKWITAPLGEFEVGGFIDRLERDEQGLVVSDYKTAVPKSIRYSADHMRQLTYYAMMCEARLGETPHSVRVYYLGGGRDEYTRDARVVSQVVTSDSIAEVRDTACRVFAQINSAVRDDAFATNVSKLCEWCSYQAWCPAFDGDPHKAPVEATQLVEVRRREVGLA